jgi:hypothetical protein
MIIYRVMAKKKSNIKQLIKWSKDNLFFLNIWEHIKDDHNRTIELNADLEKNGFTVKFFMSYDDELRLARYEYKFDKEVHKFSKLNTCLDDIWELIAKKSIEYGN